MPRRDTPPSFHGLVPLPDGWNLVIKVKYGGTLKRFNGSVNGSQFDHNLGALRSKIANAYKFSPDDEFILTYTDEDGDVVMLDDDDDLCDAAISQKLNPLRIDVQLKRAPQTKQQSSNSRSPMSTALEDQLAQVKSAIDEALKFVPDQVPLVLAKLSHDLRSKAAASAPSLAELLDRISKLMTPKSGMQPFNGLADGSSVSSSSGPQTFRNLKINRESELATDSTSQSIDMQNPKSSKALGLKSVLVEETKVQVGQAPVSSPFVSPSSGGKLFDLKRRIDAHSKGKYHTQSRGKSVISSSTPPVAAIAHGVPSLGSATGYKQNGYMPFGSNGKINGDLHSVFPLPRGTPYCPIPTLESNGKINGDVHSIFPPPRGTPYCPAPTLGSDGEINGNLHSIFPPPRGTPYCLAPTLGSEGKSNGDLHSIFPPSTVPPYSPTIPTFGSNGKINGGLQTAFPPPLAYNSPFKLSVPSLIGPYVPYQEGCSFGDSYRDPSNKYGSVPQHTLHSWIQCDGCGVIPIVGPRYKSNVKHDYDLCSTCFSRMGNEATYTRIDKPLSVNERIRDSEKARRVQLDCSFINDVTIPDGTPMPPSTPFTKIWRVRNSGSTVWPFGTQLTWVGGDQFARQSSVKLGILENGFHVGQEVDVSVEFVAPAKPGNYISYWRLASPDLQKFGQRVWVLIEVVQPVKAEMNFNLPPEGNTTIWKPTDLAYQYPGDVADLSIQYPADLAADMCTHALLPSEAIKAKGSEPSQSDMPSALAGEPIQASITDPHTSSTGAVVMPAAVPAPEATPLPKSLIVPAPALVSAPVLAPAPISMPVPVHAPAPVDVPAAPSPDEIINQMEEKLLVELERMGFRQVDLNKEILRQNEYDLLKSVDDLCGFHEWDPLLNELHELGLDDTEAREVVSSDDGESIIKRVAMNLLSREKDD